MEQLQRSVVSCSPSSFFSPPPIVSQSMLEISTNQVFMPSISFQKCTTRRHNRFFSQIQPFSSNKIISGIPECKNDSKQLSENNECRDAGPGLYTPFVDHCVEELSKRMELQPFPMKEEFRHLEGSDGLQQKAVSRSTALQAEKIRMMRAADISAGPNLQVLNLVIFPNPQYDLPFFCADLVTFPRGHLIVIDLNPLFNTEEYIDKYIRPVLPLWNKHNDRGNLPWGGEFTAESLQFFSPALIWSRLSLTENIYPSVFDAFKDYLQIWLDMVDSAEAETDEAKIAANREAQHKYVCWRCEKDPGRPVLTRLFGEERCEAYIHDFLFDGLTTLGRKKFLDYYPQYRAADGSVSKKRSMAGRSYMTRPWDAEGRLMSTSSPVV